MSSKISVIIPAYNIEKYLGELLDCLKRQTLKPYEIIVVNDGSTDYTEQVACKYKNVKVITTANQGVSAARNIGLKASSGDYIAFLDGDDLIADDYLEKLLAADGDLVKCSFEEFGDIEKTHNIKDNDVEFQKGYYHSFEYTVWASLIKRDLLDKYNIRFIDGENYAEDAPYCMLLNSLAKHFKMVDEVLYFHRRRNTSAVAGVQSGKIKPYPPFAGMKNAIDTFRKSEKDLEKLEFYDYCVLRNLASFLTTQYMFKPYDGDFRKKLTDGCREIIDEYIPHASENKYIFGRDAENIKNHPLVIRMAVKLMVVAYKWGKLYEFSSISAKMLRMTGRTSA